MPIQPIDFQRISFQDANPSLMGALSGQEMIMNAIKAQQERLANQRAEKMLPLDLQAKQFANQVAGTRAKYAEDAVLSSLKAQKALAEKNAQDAAMNAFKLNNPAFLAGGTPAQIQALQMLGNANNNQTYIPNQPTPAPANMLNRALPDQLQNQNINNVPRLPLSDRSISTLDNVKYTANPDINNLIEAMIKNPYVNMQYKQQLVKNMAANQTAKSFDLLPAREKEQQISVLRGAGLTPDEALDRLRSGESVSQIMEGQGFGKDKSKWPSPVKLVTQQTESTRQRSQAALAGLKILDPFITKANAQLGPSFYGLAPKVFLNQLTGMNKDQQSDALAAYALGPDYNALRGTALNMKVGIGALKHMEEAAMTRFKGLKANVPPDVYMDAQQKISDNIQRVNEAENNYYNQLGIANPNNKNSSNEKKGSNNFESMILNMTPSEGKSFYNSAPPSVKKRIREILKGAQNG